MYIEKLSFAGMLVCVRVARASHRYIIELLPRMLC